MNSLPPGRYRHYKGKDYTVLGTARHSETDELLVVYRQEYGDHALWVRPAAMFRETVVVDGRPVPRFRLLDRPAARTSMPDAPSLYESLGGVYAIAAVVNDFIDRVMDDPILNANPKVDEAHHRVSRAGFKYLVTEMVCWATGGPQQYTGKTMKESHQDLAITEAEWQAFLRDFDATLDKFQVPPAERRELHAIVASTKGDIVLPGGPEGSTGPPCS